MKSLHWICFCLLTIAVYLLSQNIGSSASTTIYTRRNMKEMKLSSPNCHTIKVIDDEAKQSKYGDGSSVAMEYKTTTNNPDDIVYHIDYHGVTTHPTPTPKHPKP